MKLSRPLIVLCIVTVVLFLSVIISRHGDEIELNPTLLQNPSPKNLKSREQVYQYPIISSATFSPADSNLMKIMEGLDVIDVKNDRFYFIIHSSKKHFQDNIIFADFKVEENMTASIHKKPEPYISKYFNESRYNDQNYQTMQFYSCYRTVDGCYQTMDFLAKNYPNLVDLFDIGPSHMKSIGRGGYEMKAMKLSNKKSLVEKAPLFVVCGIHPRELATTEVCARFAENMIESYGRDADKTWILDYTEIHIIMQANPDGRKDEEQFLKLRRKNLNFGTRADCMFGCGASTEFGVDLNRNFPHSQWATSGVGDFCSQVYPGRNPGSEKETRAIINYIKSVLPSGTNVIDPSTGGYSIESKGVLLDIHSYGQDFFWPFAYTDAYVSNNEFDFRAFANKMASYTNPIFDTRNLFSVASGDTTDFVYESIGAAPFTVELGNSFHQSCSYFERYTTKNAEQVILYGARVALAPYQLPKGPDSTLITLSRSHLRYTDSLKVDVTVSDRARALGFDSGNQKLTSIEMFIDSHPYDRDSSPYARITNGLNSPDATKTFHVRLSEYHKGQHIIYIQAHDEDGPGPVYSKFFDIIE